MVDRKVKLQQVLTENAIGVDEFANCLGISLTLADSLLSGKKELTSKLARQIEQTFSKPHHWLDDETKSQGGDYDLFG